MTNFAINRHTNVNEKFFDTWTPESCYVFGFLLADGCLSIHKHKRVKESGEVSIDYVKQISLWSTDRDIVDQIKTSMGAIQKISTVNRSNKLPKVQVPYQIQICNKTLVESLEQLGLEPRKSTKPMHIPESIPDSLFHHFFRGYFDGNGWISVSALGIISNTVNGLISQFISRLRTLSLPLPNETYSTHKNGNYQSASLVWCKKEHRRIIGNWMYKDATILLKVKKQKMDSLLRIEND